MSTLGVFHVIVSALSTNPGRSYANQALRLPSAEAVTHTLYVMLRSGVKATIQMRLRCSA